MTIAGSAYADTAPADPTAPSSPPTVSADSLPTAQINGVVWSQTIVGNTVYAGGDFTTAQPAGAAAGANTVSRTYVLSYNLTTGALNTAFAPVLNGQVKAVTASPDGSRIYIGGQFTTVNGVNRYRIAALDPTTGAVITSFNAGTNASVNALAASNSTVFLGGAFSSIGSSVRNKVGAVTAATGATTAFDPSALGGSVNALVVSPDGTKVVVGGSFTTLHGSSNPGYGIGMADAATGNLLPFAVNNLIRNGGSQAAILSLSTDGDSIYGSGYVFGAGGNLEGVFRSDWNGNLNWVEDCHGDTYSQASSGTVIYAAGHSHYCGNIGGFPQTSPTWTFHRGIAFSKAATQTITADPYGYYNFAGTPAPTLLNWNPDFNTGTFTGQSQGPWSIAANAQYVVYGGEFTTVNGVRQQGLSRFAVRAIAPNKQGPLYSGGTFKPSVVSLASGTARVSWTANADRDNGTLTYNVYRNGNLTTPVYTTTGDSSTWNQPSMGFTDTGLTPGSTYSYRIRATDPLGNTVIGDGVSVTITAATPSVYNSAVSADSPADFWRLGEASGSTVYDWAGFADQTATGLTRGTPGAIGGDSNAASTFTGASDGSSLSATQSAINGPQVFSIEAWFKTTTTAGGKIVGFGNANTGNSSNYDRHIYMDTSGRINFGVYPGTSRVLSSANALNDGQWHQVVGTLSSSGMQLFVDGIRVGNRTDTTSAQPYQGYWRIGGDSSWSGANYFAGAIDDVSIYGQSLSKQQVDAHWVASGRTSKLPQPPADNYGNRIFTDAPTLYWRLDDAGSTAADSGPSAAPGNYFGGYTHGVAGALTGNPNTATRFDGQNGGVSSAQQFNDPEIYSVEAWFKTTTNSGGKIIGFGSSSSGTSGSYDRHVYMQDDGKVVFGTYTGQLNTVTTPGSFNDGLWHQVVATQSSGGLKLYVDGALMGTNPTTSAQAYTGYWRVGGDTTWGSSSAFFAGTIDEAAVYDTALPAATVSQHYALGTATPANAPPTASFTQTVSNLSVAFNGSASADSDGSIAGYAWNFGDGGTATTVSPTHVYAAAGTYTVTLTVTDNQGATGVFSQSVTAVAPHVNVAPTASFTNSIDHLVLSVDGSGSSDSDGTVAGYLWNFGDGGTATTATATHTYAAAGTYQVKLTVTDNNGATGTSTTPVTAVAAPPPNVPPTASFTSGHTDLTATFDASGSTDTDGTIATYAWKFGDGATATGKNASHAYAAAGTYSVMLTVTDNQGATGTSTASVMVTAPVVNAPPTAAIDSTVTNLSVALDASGSADSDGTITGYAWNFGDSTTGSGKTVNHSYAQAGTYTVTLTVTDNGGATGTATATVTATAPAAMPFALDSFSRTMTNGFGTADVGGAWTRWGAASNLSVGNGSGTVLLSAPGAQAGASMDSVVQQDTDLRVQFSVDKAATGGGTYLYATGRKVSANNEYRASIHLKSNGTVAVGLVALKGSATGVTLGSEVVASGTIVAGTKLSVRMQVTGTNPTTIKAKVWVAGTPEPTAWTVQATDSYAGLQAPGGIGVIGYLSGSATNAPQNLSVQELSAFKP